MYRNYNNLQIRYSQSFVCIVPFRLPLQCAVLALVQYKLWFSHSSKNQAKKANQKEPKYPPKNWTYLAGCFFLAFIEKRSFGFYFHYLPSESKIIREMVLWIITSVYTIDWLIHRFRYNQPYLPRPIGTWLISHRIENAQNGPDFQIFFTSLNTCIMWARIQKMRSEKIKQAGAELGQAQQIGFQTVGLFGFCCRRQAESSIRVCMSL